MEKCDIQDETIADECGLKISVYYKLNTNVTYVSCYQKARTFSACFTGSEAAAVRVGAPVAFPSSL